MTRNKQFGFTLLETMVSLAVLLVVGSIVMAGMGQLLRTQGSIANRTEMHSGVRSATELLQQEIGQAGRLSLGGSTANVTLAANVAANQVAATNFTLNTSGGAALSLYPGEVLTVDVGAKQESVQLATGANAAGSAIFQLNHSAGAPVTALGAFATGIVPPGTVCGAANCGSSATVLKLYGDINGDGNMVYVEYTCDTVGGNLYRNSMAFDAAAKPALTPSQILLSNIQPNPGGTACFTYMPTPLPIVGANTYVLDVAITLTVQTQARDPITQQFQTETKALLNVSPRNVFDVWQLASLGTPYTSRVQPMPATVAALLP